MIALFSASVLWVVLRRTNITKRVAFTILIPYLFLVVASTIITRRVRDDAHVILKPFWTIQTILTGGQQKAWLLKEVILNILMLLPVGLLAPALFEKRKLGKTMLLGCGISASIEISQLITHRGYSEVDDIIYNMLGVLIGFGIYCVIKRRQNSAQQ